MGAAMSRQSIVAPIGLITQPNKYGQYKRGALSRADNVVMRSPGIIGSMPGVRTLRASVATGTDRIIRTMLSADTHTLQYLENTAVSTAALSWVSASGVQTVSLPTNWEGGAVAGCARIAKARERFFFTPWSSTISNTRNFRGPLTIDSENASSSRMMGLSPVALINLGIGYTADAQAILADSAAGWRALMRRKLSDDYELVSAPSWPAIGFTGGSTMDAQVIVWFPTDHNYIAGDLCEVYRTVSVEGADTDPGDVCFLAVSQVITAANITAGFVSIRDNCPDGSLGAELYTNQGQEGAEAANFDPIECTDMCNFKGHLFFAAPTAPAKATIGPRNAYGKLTTDYERLYGIGDRTTTGTFTIGSPIITAVNNMRGIVVGSYIIHANLPGGDAFVIGVTATTITCDSNASASAVASTFHAQDSIEWAQNGFGFIYTLQAKFFAQNSVLLGFGGSTLVWSASVAGKTDMTTGEELDAIRYGAEFIVRAPRVYGQPFTLRSTNGVNFSPPLPEKTATANSYSPEVRHNRYGWSKFQQPEAAPPLNYGFCGSGKILRLMATRDAVWFFCTDGMYRLSGTGGDGPDAWRLDAADPNLVLAGRNAICTLKETIWCYSNRGLVAVSDDGGIQEISLGVIGDSLPGASFADTWDTWMAADEAHQEVWLTFRSGTLGAGSSITYIFNTLTKTFVRFTDANEYSTAVYAPFLRSLVLGKVTAASPAGNPSQMYFEDDTSNTRLAGADVRFQPFFVNDPFDLKQFVDVTYIFNNVGASVTLTPGFDDTDSIAFTCNTSTAESRATAGVPRRCAIAPVLRPGFKLSGYATPWDFRGISVRFTSGGEETERD
jgi:hypothetical protein